MNYVRKYVHLFILFFRVCENDDWEVILLTSIQSVCIYGRWKTVHYLNLSAPCRVQWSMEGGIPFGDSMITELGQLLSLNRAYSVLPHIHGDWFESLPFVFDIWYNDIFLKDIWKQKCESKCNYNKENWASAWQSKKMTFAPSERSVWVCAHADQSLCCPHKQGFGPTLPSECWAKTLIRLGGCPG